MLRDSRVKWVFLLPGVLVTLLITIVPVAQAVNLSFQEWIITQSPEPTGYVGLDNYRRALTDGNFWNALWITTAYTLMSVVFSLVIGLWIAVALKTEGRWSGLLKATLIFPFAIPLVLRGYSYRFMLVEGDGVLDLVLDTVFPFWSDVPWLNEPGWALFWIAAPTFWAWGPLSGLMLLGAINNIPQDIFEAASLDGARAWRQLTSITLPLLRPMVLVVSLLTALFSIAMFDLVQTMTKGGPGRATETLNYFVYRVGFGQFDTGYASALAVLLTIALAALAYVYSRLLKI